MVGARWNRLGEAILVCARGRCFGQQYEKYTIFSSKKIDVYCMGRFSMGRFSKC